MPDFGINLCFWQPYHTFSVIPAPLFLPFHRILSLGAHAAIPAAERESSGVERVVLWNPRHAENDRTLTLQAKREKEIKGKQAKTRK